MRFTKFVLSTVVLLGLSAVAHANQVINPDFFATNPAPGYGPIAGWTQGQTGNLPGFPYLSGSDTMGGAFWDNGTAGTAQTVGFAQAYGPVTSISLSQTLTLIPGQYYSFSYLENGRSGQAPLVTVLLDGNPLIGQHLASQVGTGNPFRQYTKGILATGTEETLTFLVSQRNSSDATALFTDVSVNLIETPEPSSLALLGTGLLGAVGMVRRKIAKA